MYNRQSKLSQLSATTAAAAAAIAALVENRFRLHYVRRTIYDVNKLCQFQFAWF